MLYNGQEIKKLGFGLMRLPLLSDGEIDIEQVKTMVDMFMEKGFTYFDTAYGYHSQKSESAAKIALVDRYPRESFQIATKLPAWAGPKNEEEAKEMFYTSLERCGVSYFDFYLLHNLGSKRTQVFEDYNIWQFLLERKAEGKIKKLGFSIHDNADALEKVLEKHHEDVDFVQLQINYADWENTTIQSRKCYEVAKKYGKEIIVMEPIRGGSLASPPKEVGEVLKAENPNYSFASWALRYAASLDGIITVLSGMSNIEQMKDNLNTFDNFTPLNEKENNAIKKAQEILDSIPYIPCTNCKYCTKDCPMNIEIADMLNAMNVKIIYDDIKGAKLMYKFADAKGGSASECIACGLCEGVCPQSIAIIDELSKIASTLQE